MVQGLLSVILLSYNSEKNLDMVSGILITVLEQENIPFELIIIDDGSSDQSFEVSERLEHGDSRIRSFQLSRNFTSSYSAFAGFSVSRGACATFIPDDLQGPIDLIVKMYRYWEQGEKLVVGYRSSRGDGIFTDLFANLYYRMMNAFSDINYPKGGTDIWLADREIIDLLNNRIRPIRTSINVEVLRLGFDPVFLPYDRPKSKNKSRWTFRKKWRLALDSFFTTSAFPIKLIVYLGLLIFTLALCTIPFLIIAKYSDNNLFGFTIPGWTSLLIVTIFFNGLILLCIGIVAEYVWRVYEEVKDRPGYIIRKKDNKGDEQ